MPIVVGNVGTKSLAQIVGELADAPGAHELRGKGSELHAKEKPARFFSKATSRAAHRRAAIEMVQNGLQSTFQDMSRDLAARIMTSVFGAAPAKITVQQARELNEASSRAVVFVAEGHSAEAAFEMVKHAAVLKERGLGDADARLGASLVYASIQNGNSGVKAIDGVVAVRLMVAGRITAEQARSQVDDQSSETFMATLASVRDTLPSYERADPAVKRVWLGVAQLYGGGLVIPASLQRLPVAQKASMLEALSDEVITHAIRDEVRTIKIAYDHVIYLNRGFTLAELMPQSEVDTRDRLYGAMGREASLREARTQWGTMEPRAKTEAIQRMVDMHADHFGYQVGAEFLQVREDEEGIEGSLSHDGMVLTINSNGESFRDFDMMFNTLMHECTHRYQHRLMADRRSGAIGDAHVLRDQARVMKANHGALVSHLALMRLGMAQHAAYDAYRHQPLEEHAHHVGIDAQPRAKEIFG